MDFVREAIFHKNSMIQKELIRRDGRGIGIDWGGGNKSAGEITVQAALIK